MILLFGAGGSLGFSVGLIVSAVRTKKRGNLGDVRAPLPISTGFTLSSFIALSVVFALGLSWLALQNEITLNLNISFQQRLAILSPFLTGLEEKQLKARWASMRGRQDFDKLNEGLEADARRYGIVFPRPLPGY
jgi:hypothetical protein